MRIGCHAVLFQERIVEEGDAIISKADEIGFEGIEIGSRFFGVENKNGLESFFAGKRIELSGMHVGTTWDGWITDPDGQREKVLEVARFLDGFPNRNVIMSCKAPGGEIDVAGAARAIDAAAAACAQEGAILHYHNHGWEYEVGATMYSALRDHAPKLSFALDLGWVENAGGDVLGVIGEVADRVSYVHIRDRGSDGFADLGEGNTDLKAIIDALRPVLGETGFMVVEYEEGEQDMERYRRALAYVRGPAGVPA